MSLQGITLDFNEFFNAYLETAFWSSNDYSGPENGNDPPLDENYCPDDLDAASYDCLKVEALRFFNAHYDAISDGPSSGQWTPFSVAGHDFWLTRNHHGAGFWDGDWAEPDATTLTDASDKMGEIDLYVGDDGKVYASGCEQVRLAPPKSQTEKQRMHDFFFGRKGSFWELPSWRKR